MALLAVVAIAAQDVDGALSAALIAVVLVLPGDLARRALFPGWSLGGVEQLLVSVVLSYATIAVVGGVLAAFDLLTFGPVVVASVTCLVGLAVVAWRRDRAGVPATVGGISVLAIAGGISMLLFDLYPIVGDRVLLGQLQISLELVEQGGIPTSSVAFGGPADFPIHYAFYSSFISIVTILTGNGEFPGWQTTIAVLRGVHVALFAIAWFAAARALLARRGRETIATLVCAAGVPMGIFLNIIVRAKYREALVEGFAIALGAIVLLAAVRWTENADHPRRWSAVAMVSVGLLVGTHLPGLVAALLFAGAWFLVMPAPDAQSRERRWRRAWRWVRSVAGRSALLALGALIGMIVMQVLAGGSPLDLLLGAQDAGAMTAEETFRAFKFLLGDPLNTDTVRESLINRRLSSIVVLTRDPHTGPALLIGALAVIGLVVGVAVRQRIRARTLLWSAVAVIVTMVYVGTGLVFGESITPWNAVMRNTFYVWFPIVIAAAIGLQSLLHACGHLVPPRIRTAALATATIIVGLGSIAAMGMSLERAVGDNVREYGWVMTGVQVTPEGQEALRWIADNTPQDAQVAMSELTYGSELVADRRILTEGKGTVESPQVMSSAEQVMTATYEFFLPVRSPRLFIEFDVDYLVVADNAEFGRRQVGGLPVLTKLSAPLPPRAPVLELDLPYLEPVHRSGSVIVYEVIEGQLPSLSTETLELGEPVPACQDDVCIFEVPAGEEGCPPEQTSTERGACLVRISSAKEQQ